MGKAKYIIIHPRHMKQENCFMVLTSKTTWL